MPCTAVCDGAKAATTKPSENISAIESIIDSTKIGNSHGKRRSEDQFAPKNNNQDCRQSKN